MEQAQYWMLTKREHSMRAHVQTSSYNDSWEEQAFAEDSAGPLGGCIWPPRSYSCNFCRREFRSAQALGGHMNVHRRDRARLRQSPCPHNEILHQHHQNHENPSTSLGVQYPSQVCTLLYNPKCNSNPSIIASPLSPSKVSSPYTQENCSEQIFFSPPDSPPTVQEQQKVSFFSPPPSWSDSVSVKILTVSDSKIKEKKKLMVKESGCGSEGDFVKPDLAVSLNFVVHRNRSSETDGGDEEAISRKRRRTDATSLPFFLKPDPVDRHHFQSEVLGHSQSSMEDLDLELRLGDRPKVK